METKDVELEKNVDSKIDMKDVELEKHEKEIREDNLKDTTSMETDKAVK